MKSKQEKGAHPGGRRLGLVVLLCLTLGIGLEAWSQNTKPPKLHGKALKAKMASIEILNEKPLRDYTRLGPLWASKSNMERTMKELRKQAAKMGADAVIDLRVRTEKLQSTSYDPGWWGPGYGGGFGSYGGYWGGMGYWGGYAQAHTYTQPVVTGWAIRWNEKNGQDLGGQDPGR